MSETATESTAPLPPLTLHLWEEFKHSSGATILSQGTGLTHMPYHLDRDGSPRPQEESITLDPDWLPAWEAVACPLGGKRDTGFYVFPASTPTPRILAAVEAFFGPMGCIVVLNQETP